jgi:hypothetical protein
MIAAAVYRPKLSGSKKEDDILEPSVAPTKPDDSLRSVLPAAEPSKRSQRRRGGGKRNGNGGQTAFDKDMAGRENVLIFLAADVNGRDAIVGDVLKVDRYHLLISAEDGGKWWINKAAILAVVTS